MKFFILHLSLIVKDRSVLIETNKQTTNQQLTRMKLLEKPIIKLNPNELNEMRERIEYVRCVTGHSIASFSIKLGIRADRMRDIIKGRKKPTITVLDSLLEIFPIISRAWLYSATGESGMTEKNIEPYVYRSEPKDPVDRDLCSRVREVRESLGMTQIIFASHLRTTRDVINWVENARGNPSATLLQRICEKFAVDDRWLLRGIGKMYSPKLKALAQANLKVNVAE